MSKPKILEVHEDMSNEVWRHIPYGIKYEVSNHGRVRRKYRKFKNKGYNYLKINKSVCGYGRVSIDKKQMYVHKLVAEAFLEKEPQHQCVNHKDGNKMNNDVNNLEWCTYKHNINHAIDNGLMPKTNSSCLTENDVLQIRSLHEHGWFKKKDIAKAYNITRGSVYNIISRKTWKWL